MLTEYDKIILDNELVSEEFSNYFSQIIDSFDLYFLWNHADNMLTTLTILCQN